VELRSALRLLRDRQSTGHMNVVTAFRLADRSHRARAPRPIRTELARVLAEVLGDERRRAEMGRGASAWSRLRSEPARCAGLRVHTLPSNPLTIEE
jgi:hypothetical protein